MSFQLGAGEAVTLVLAGIGLIVWLVRLESKVRECQIERKNDVEVFNVKLGSVTARVEEHQRRISERVSDLVRIVGRARVFEDTDSE